MGLTISRTIVKVHGGQGGGPSERPTFAKKPSRAR
jgi:hypothetical protein